jgi:hypothetical protein
MRLNHLLLNILIDCHRSKDLLLVSLHFHFIKNQGNFYRTKISRVSGIFLLITIKRAQTLIDQLIKEIRPKKGGRKKRVYYELNKKRKSR